MVKFKKDYSRKKKPKESVVNLFYLNVTNHHTHIHLNTQSTSKSSSGDTFDQLVKGPVYNACQQSISSYSGYEGKFFSRRQDTVSFYKSDAELSRSSSTTGLLFKDSTDLQPSDPYSPSHLPTPPEYCKVKNKLVRLKGKITINQKRPLCIRKKRPKICQKKLRSKVEELSYATSSTPTHPMLNKQNWLDPHFSPIMPPQFTPGKNISTDDMFRTEDDKSVFKRSSGHGLTALINGLGNLELTTPHRSRLREVEECVRKSSSPDLIFFKSPESEKEKNLEVSLSHLEKSDGEVSQQRTEPEQVDFGSSQALTNNKNLESNKEDLKKLVISTPNHVSFSEPENVEESSGGIPFLALIEKDNDQPERSANPSNNFKPDCSSIAESCKIYSERIKLNCLIPTVENNQMSENCLNNTDVKPLEQLRREKSPSVALRDDESQVPSHINIFQLGSSNLNDSFVKQSVPSGKENKKPEIRFSTPITRLQNIKKNSSLHLSDSRVQELNNTSLKVSLDPGKRWRRSLLQQKQPDSKFGTRRTTIGPDTLVKLIKDASINVTNNETNFSCNTTTRTIDGRFGDHKLRNNSSFNSSACGSVDLNFTMSRFSQVYMRRKKTYKIDMNEIPEESSDHSASKSSNESELSKESSALHPETGETLELKDNDENSSVQSNILETPPILKMNPEALSAITDRKRTRRANLMFTPGRGSIYDDVEDSEILEEENDLLFISCCSKLEDERVIKNLDEYNIQEMGKMGVLLRCGQQAPISFSEAFPDRVLNGQKIGEGVFGEVFMLKRPGAENSVIKIIPVEGEQLVNGEHQKYYDEVLSELIITEELSLLRKDPHFCTSGFCELKGKFCLQGEYPSQLLRFWHEYDNDKSSENDCPEMFGPEQLYLVLELEHAGEPVESFKFRSPREAFAVFLQTTFSLAVAEGAIEFEHRDLHVGNILMRKTTEKYISYKMDGLSFDCPSYGIRATIIDYTLSRILFKDDVLYFDLEKDPELFTAEGDYQFEIYRQMRSDLNNNWRQHQSKTNVRWLHYLIDKFVSVIRYKQRKTKTFTEYMKKMIDLREIIIDFYSAADLAYHLSQSYYNTMSLIRTN